MIGLDLLGAVSVPPSNVGSIFDDLDIFDTSDYDNGQKLVLQMNQYFNALGRPREFEAQAEAVWTAYEKARTSIESSSTAKHYAGTQMKQVGADAARLMDALQKAYATKSTAAPAGLASEVYQPGVDKPGAGFSLPWWGWGLGGLAAISAIGYFALPALLPALVRTRAS